jgi:hypothetical protein
MRADATETLTAKEQRAFEFARIGWRRFGWMMLLRRRFGSGFNFDLVDGHGHGVLLGFSG